MERTSKRLSFAYDYHQLYVYDTAHEFPEDGNAFLDALAAANEAGLTVGARSGIVDILMPRMDNFSAKLELRMMAAPPPLDKNADHVVEFDVTSSGRLKLEASGGSGEVEIGVASGHYRARLSGFAFDAAVAWSYDEDSHPADHYRLELWRASESSPPTELMRWAGYADRP